MQEGKLNWDDLSSIIDKNRGAKREEVKIRSSVGEDCSVVSFGEYDGVFSTDPITGADNNIGKLAVHINCNDIASSGVEPLGIMVTILAPINTTVEEISQVMKEISDECKKLNIEVLGGHTERTSAVNKLIVSCTVIGKGVSGDIVATSGAKVGDDVVVTKKLCLEGSAIVAGDFKSELEGILTSQELDEALNYAEELSVIKEGKIAGEFKVNSMHDITEGGVLGALFELASASKCGFKVYEDKMPISDVTNKICKHFNIDPLRFISSGSMLITCENGEELIRELGNNNIEASIIGKIIEDTSFVLKDKEGTDNTVTPPERDELYKIGE